MTGKLEELLAAHLETAERIERKTNLAALGLDSLMCMELAADVKKHFGIELDLHSINEASTFGDLYDQVAWQAKIPASKAESKRVLFETVVYKVAGNLPLHADIYYPTEVTKKRMPVGKALWRQLKASVLTWTKLYSSTAAATAFIRGRMSIASTSRCFWRMGFSPLVWTIVSVPR